MSSTEASVSPTSSGPKISETITENVSAAGQTISNALNSAGEGISNAAGSVKETLNEFSSKSAVDASTEFLESNSILAKFAFLILVLI
jgi:hypothetical protein